MLAALALPLLAASSYAASVCNGAAALCERKYSNVTYIGTHNSYAVGAGLADNQHKDVTDQLNDGVRALQVQAHDFADTVQLCHSSCALKNGGTLQDYLTKVNSWLTANPNEVVTMVMVNIDNMPASKFASVFQAAGLDQKAYSPPAATVAFADWPTLGSLIDSGKQLVVFIDNQAAFESTPWIIDEFTNIWEDAYDVTDQTFGCAVNRTKGQANAQMYMINHFLDTTFSLAGQQVFIPDTNKLNETNAASGPGSIGYHVDNCMMLYGRAPTIILLDYYDSNGAAPFQAAAQLNGIEAPTQAVTPFTATGALSASGGPKPTDSGNTDAKISTAPVNGGASRSATAVGAGAIVAAAFALLA